MRDLEKALRDDFGDREYRESYAAGFLNTWISQQLAAVRRQRGLTQDQLAALVGTKQSGISRMERDDYGRWNFVTLQKVAFALGCRLKVSLETFGSLIWEALHFSEQNLERPSFESDPFFTGNQHYDLAPAGGGPLGEMKRKLIPWLLEGGSPNRLADWLQGYDLPAAGEEIPPAEWLLQATSSDPDLRQRLARHVNLAIENRWDVAPPGRRKEELVRNLLRLAAGIRLPLILGEAISVLFKRRSELVLTGSADPVPGHPLVTAVVFNQPDARYEGFWKKCFLKQRRQLDMPEYVAMGMIGMAKAGLAPNVAGIVRGANEARDWKVPRRTVVRILQGAFEAVWATFPEIPQLRMDVIYAAQVSTDGWSQDILSAWRKSLGDRPEQPEIDMRPIVKHAVEFVDNIEQKVA